MPNFFFSCRHGVIFVCTAIVGLCVTPTASAMPAIKPRQMVVFRDARHFLAQDAWNTVTLHRISDGVVLQRFDSTGWLRHFLVTPDEKSLLLIAAGGRLSLWDITTGQQLWRQRVSHDIRDASFANDGRSFVVTAPRSILLILQTSTGQLIQSIRSANADFNLYSPALAPDGASGVAIGDDGFLYTFQTNAGQLVQTTAKGAGLVRFSVDGKFIACHLEESEGRQDLRILDVHDNLAVRDISYFYFVDSIGPAADGGFLVAGFCFDADFRFAGIEVQPKSGVVQRLWGLPLRPAIYVDRENLGFDSQGRIGVATDYSLITHVYDLKTGKMLYSLDNSANSQPGLDWPGVLIGIAILAGMAVVVLGIRHRWPASNLMLNRQEEVAAILSPFAAMIAYEVLVVGKSPINFLAYVGLGVVAGMLCILDHRAPSLQKRCLGALLYGFAITIAYVWCTQINVMLV